MKFGQVYAAQLKGLKASPSQVDHCQLILAAVSDATGVRRQDFFAPSRRAMKTANARQLAMYLCHVLSGLTMTDVGAMFGRDRTTVSHACAQIEDSREDPQVEDQIQAIEAKIIMAKNGAVRSGSGVRGAVHATH